jgi:hypothetical protein
LKPRALAALMLLTLWGCGTLIDDVLPTDAGLALVSDSGMGTTGLACASDDPCVCTPCTSTAQCQSGLSCTPGRRRGVSCADGRSVCIAP